MAEVVRTAQTQPQAPGRVPPQSLEAEMAVLGAVLLDNNAFSIATESLNHLAFYKKGHQDIFAAMEGLSGRGEAIDVVTLSEELKQRGTFLSSGGATYLTQIMDSVHTAANVEYYANIVLEKFVMRELISVSNQLATQCFAAERDVSDILDDAERKIFEISQRGLFKGFESIASIIKKHFGNIEALASNESHVSGLATGYSNLDAMTAGLQKGDLIILAGRPSMGKTSFALNLCEHVAIKDSKPAAVFSLEMSAEALVTRLLCSQAKVSAHKLRGGYVSLSHDVPNLISAANRLTMSPIFIDDSAAPTMQEIRAKARRIKAEQHIELLVIDYLQMIRSNERTENRQQEISMISRSLKVLAKELDIPVIALSQLSRAVESRNDRRPMLSDLRESGSLEQDSDLVMFLYRAEIYERDKPELKGRAELIVAKQRNGPTGSIPLTFIHEHTLFVPGYDEPAGFE